MERKVLGRGLDALIPKPTESESREKVETISVEKIHASHLQPRSYFDPKRIEELAQSIKEKGVIQPILVRPTTLDQYELIAGERRFRAVKHLGLREIPAIIRRVADGDVLEMSIIENIQREELNALEEAKAYRRLVQEFGMSQDLIAERVGKDKTSISNLLRILNLPQKIQDYLQQNMISFGHARAILSLSEADRQVHFCERVIKKGFSVRQTEQEISRSHVSKSRRGRHSVHDVDLKHLEERLQHALGTKVRIFHGKKRGKIVVEYYSLDDLDRVLRKLGA